MNARCILKCERIEMAAFASVICCARVSNSRDLTELMAMGEVRNGSLRPHRPMPQQAAGKSKGLSTEVKLREQVVQNLCRFPV